MTSSGVHKADGAGAPGTGIDGTGIRRPVPPKGIPGPTGRAEAGPKGFSFARLTRSRLLRISVVVLLVVSVVQVGWWFLDQRNLVDRYVDQISFMYHQDRAVAQSLEAHGLSEKEINQLLPHINLTAEGAQVVPEVVSSLEDERQRRVIRWGAEGSFFILVLVIGGAVVLKALQDEADIRRNQDNFLMLVSHEFKTPLASLQLAAETMLRRRPGPQDLDKKLYRMLSDLHRMQNMVSKILDSARLQQGQVHMNKDLVNLSEAVTKALHQVQSDAQDRAVSHIVSVPDDLVVYADAMALETVLLNIIENAYEAMRPNKSGTLTIEAATPPGLIELSIQDDGIGFAPEKRADLFGKFYRTDDTYCGDKKGTGLGLFIVARLMRLQNGRVRAESAGPGTGARFTLTWTDISGRRA